MFTHRLDEAIYAGRFLPKWYYGWSTKLADEKYVPGMGFVFANNTSITIPVDILFGDQRSGSSSDDSIPDFLSTIKLPEAVLSYEAIESCNPFSECNEFFLMSS